MNIKLISIVVPCYNEDAIIEKNITAIINYLNSYKRYNWEIVIINDGSKDDTGRIADKLSEKNEMVRVIHHPVNLNLGHALQTGFGNSKGEIIVVMDIDLSYSVDHIGRMVEKMQENSCDIVVASPYMKGGNVINVPFLRRIMSKWLNWFMSYVAQEKYYTFTGMVRAYKADFIKNVNLKTKD